MVEVHELSPVEHLSLPIAWKTCTHQSVHIVDALLNNVIRDL